MEELPTVTLDTTLADLYAISRNGERTPRIGLVPCGWSSGMDIWPGMPRNRRYTYQEPITTARSEAECNAFSPDKIRDIQCKILSLVSQRDCFAAGNMTAILFTFDKLESDPPYTQTEALETIRCLAQHQRPQYLFCPSPQDMPLLVKDNRLDAIALKVPWDSAESLDHVMHMHTWYYLNSKAAICDSGLPTPPTAIINPDFYEDEPRDCCSACASNESTREIPSSCSGSRLPWLQRQVSKIVGSIQSRALPFVVKFQQSVGGGGTWILLSELDRRNFIDLAKAVLLPKLLTSWTSLNRDLGTTAVVLMDYVPNVLRNWGLTFFVTRSGSAVFLAASEQRLIDGRLWHGSAIKYSEQDALKKKFDSIMQKITDFVHHRQIEGRRYYGPMGADVLEIPPPDGESEPSDEEYLVVDLNVRIPGSLTLAVLKSYFTSSESHPNGPLDWATNHTLQMSIGREAFISKFRYEIYELKAIVITAWYHDIKSGLSHTTLVVGGRTEAEMDALTARINEVAQVLRFS